ncbi:CLUMA_CG007487, isoform A [Clunio marinus]|uniref:CLUMA_CG007487, isoform A n=1 Tax=Clunio marinus TaxID=568069 RepID=A0A1J1I6D3_9DIPT|nr:CLUMA_CG007487, isoform A [Clunio marinus]
MQRMTMVVCNSKLPGANLDGIRCESQMRFHFDSLQRLHYFAGFKTVFASAYVAKLRTLRVKLLDK